MGKERQGVSNELALKVAKEIVVKFIEMGKVSPATFEETFDSVYNAIQKVSSKGDK